MKDNLRRLRQSRARASDISNVWRELDDQRSTGGALSLLCEPCSGGRRITDHDAAFLDVRAGDVQFIGCDAVAIVQDSDGFEILVVRVPKHVRDDSRIVPGQERKFFLHERSRANVLKADRVQHTAVRFDYSRGGFPDRGRAESPL